MFTVTVRVKPGASRARVGGVYGAPQDPALVVAVTARPVDGAANEAVCRAVAAAFGLRPRAVTLASGGRSRTKVLVVDLDPVAGQRRLTQLLAEQP